MITFKNRIFVIIFVNNIINIRKMKLLKLTDKFENGKFKNKRIRTVINYGELKYLSHFLGRNKNHRLHKESITYIQSKYQLNASVNFLEVMETIKPQSN